MLWRGPEFTLAFSNFYVFHSNLVVSGNQWVFFILGQNLRFGKRFILWYWKRSLWLCDHGQNSQLLRIVNLQAVTSTKTVVTLSTVTVTMELLALVAVSVFAIQVVGTRFRDYFFILRPHWLIVWFQGSSCSLVQGGDGTCQEHICTPSGTPKIGEITVRIFDIKWQQMCKYSNDPQ